MRCEVGMGHSVKQEQPRAYPAFSRFFDRNSTFEVTDFQQSSCQFGEGEFDRGRYLLTFPARQALVPQRVCFARRLRSRWRISSGIFLSVCSTVAAALAPTVQVPQCGLSDC